MKICIDSDSTGAPMKKFLMERLGWAMTDLESSEVSQYPDIAWRMANRIAHKEFERGILICGTGLGMAMMANKVKGIYAGTPQNKESAKHMARSNHAQIITFGCNVHSPFEAEEMIKVWMETPFEPRLNADRMRYLESQ